MRVPLGAGDIARLRRDPLSSSAFYQLRFGHLNELTLSEEDEGRWAVLIQAMATLAGLYDDEVFLGTALAHAGMSELRLQRLLRADPEILPHQILTAARFLASKGASQNMFGFAQLLGLDRTEQERVRQRIAGQYYAALTKKK